MRTGTRRLNTAAPMLWAALSFAAGVIIGRLAWRPAAWWLCALLAGAAAATVFAWRTRGDAEPRLLATVVAPCAALLALFCAGALAGQARTSPAVPAELAAVDGARMLVVGHVIREGPPGLGGAAPLRDTFDLETESLQPLDKQREPAGTAVTIRVHVRVNVYRGGMWDASSEDDAPASVDARYGQRVRFAGTLRLPRNFGNPGSFDYRQYLLDRGIVAQATTRTDRLEMLAGWEGSRVAAWRARVRRSLLEHIGRTWPAADAGILQAMLVSERSMLDSGTRTTFQRTGIFHLLVVSGLHVGIIGLFVFRLARLVRLGEFAATFAMLLFAAGFAWINDDGAPVWRATLMLAVYMVTRLLYRARAPLNAIGAAALLMLAWNPQQLFGASFQLSFVAVLAIAAVAAPAIERTSAPWRRALSNFDSTGYDAVLAPRLAQFRLDLRLIAGRLSRFVPAVRGMRATPLRVATWFVVFAAHAAFRTYELVIVSLAMQLCLALPMAWYFHRTITLGVPANLLAVPLAGMLLPSAAAAVAGSYVWAGAAKPLAAVAAFALHAVQGSAGALLALHGRDLRVPTPSAWIIVAAVLAFGFAAWALHRTKWLALSGIAALAAAALCIGVVPPRPEIRAAVLEFTAIDVGQGDALFIATPQGRTLLIDGGGQVGGSRSAFDYGEDVVSPYLWQRGIARIDAIALTHAHQDHIGGLAAVIRNFRPRELWVGINPDTSSVRALLAEAAANGVRVVRHVEGDAFAFGGVEVSVLAPPADWRPKPDQLNNDSLAMRLRYGATTLLLPGDVEKKIERSLAHEPISADVLKVGHHGSATSTTDPLLGAAHPRFAVISSGAHNPFGHPRADVLARLAAGHVRTWRTDTMGAVSFFLDGREVQVTASALR